MGEPCRLVGHGFTQLTRNGTETALSLMLKSFRLAVDSAGLRAADIDGLVALPSLISENQFMQAHQVATAANLLPRPNFIARTLDVGGAGPVAAVLQACRMIQMEGRTAVAVVAADCAGSAPAGEFLHRADSAACLPGTPSTLPSPIIPHAYDLVAQWQMQQHGVTRQQLAMCASLMALQASRHPCALVRKPVTVEEVLQSPAVAPVTSRMECARRADGGAALIVASTELLRQRGLPADSGVVVLGGAERSGPFSPELLGSMSEESFHSAAEAATAAYQSTSTTVQDMDYFSLYDCFPVCLIRAVEAVGLSGQGQGGAYIQRVYEQLMGSDYNGGSAVRVGGGRRAAEVFPVNTHGGLLGFGAPWEVPAMYGIIEAYEQLKGRADGRQVRSARRALVYGNGGVLSASAVVILEQPAAVARGRL